MYALVDCNNFFASCERVFQPQLRGKPLVVLSNNDGCIIARSNEAKAVGIAMGEPYHLAKPRLKKFGVHVRSSNFVLYGDMSDRVMSVLAQFTPKREIYSIDEAFLDVAGLGDRLEAHVRDIRAKVLQWTGMPVSIGVANTKTLAKAANRMAKKEPKHGGVFTLRSEADVEAALGAMELQDVWGIGKSLAESLARYGWATPLALRQADAKVVRSKFNVIVERLVLELQGTPCLSISDVGLAKQTIISSRAFGRPITQIEEMYEAISTYVGRAAEKLRRDGQAAGALTVYFHTNRHRPQDKQYQASRTVTLPAASAETARLVMAAKEGIRGIWKDDFRYKKCGVVLFNLMPLEQVQGSLFGTPDDDQTIHLMQAVDGLNQRYGRDTVLLAAEGIRKDWRMKAGLVSKHYTTEWNEVLEVGDERRRA